MAFTRVIAMGANLPVTVVQIGAASNVTRVPQNSTSYYCNYKLDQNSEVAYFNAPEGTTFTTSDYVVLGKDGFNTFMKGADYTATYIAVA